MAKPPKGPKAKEEPRGEVILGVRVPIITVRHVAFYSIEGKCYVHHEDAALKTAEILGRAFIKFMNEQETSNES